MGASVPRRDAGNAEDDHFHKNVKGPEGRWSLHIFEVVIHQRAVNALPDLLDPLGSQGNRIMQCPYEIEIPAIANIFGDRFPAVSEWF